MTKLIILDRHKCYNCTGTMATLTKVMRDIHTNGLKKLVGQTVKGCITCQKLLAFPFKYPDNPPLPNFRLVCERPFSMCGVDFIGPFKAEVVNTDGETDLSLKSVDGVNESRTSHKLYVVIFTCLVTRAICLIVTPNRSTEFFLGAIRQLACRYTEPKLMVSDNEGAFRKASEILLKIAQDPKLKSCLSRRGIK